MLTNTDGKTHQSSVDVLTAYYSGTRLVVLEWSAEQNGITVMNPSKAVTATVRGRPARMERVYDGWNGDTVGVADVQWIEDGIVFHVVYEGSTEEAVRIAEGIPDR